MYEYPRAGVRGVPELAAEIEDLLLGMTHLGIPPERIGPTLVQGFARFYRRVPSEVFEKSQVPLLYSLLGSGTPPLKMSHEDAAYQGHPVGQQRCEHCSSSYKNVSTGDLICSQIEGEIEVDGWCRLFNLDRF